MKGRILSGICLSAITLLVGCSNFWQAPSTTTTTTTPTTLSSGVFYVLNQQTKQIVAYSISSGTLENVSVNQGTFSAAPYCIAVAPGGGFLYVGTVAGIYLYTIGSGGALTLANSQGTISSEIPTAIQVDPSGKWLVDATATASGGVQVNAIPITSAGILDSGRTEQVPQAFSATNASVNGMAISSDGKYVFVAGGTAGTFIIPFYSGNAGPLATSNAQTIHPVHSGGSDLSVAVDPTNRLFYIGETLANSGGTSGGLRIFNYSTLTEETTYSPLATGTSGPNAILPDPAGDFVYVANGAGTGSNGNIGWFPITASGTTYTVAAGSTIAAGIDPRGLAEDSLGHFVLAVSAGGGPDLEAYTLSSGALTAAITSNTGTDPVQAYAVGALP